MVRLQLRAYRLSYPAVCHYDIFIKTFYRNYEFRESYISRTSCSTSMSRVMVRGTRVKRQPAERDFYTYSYFLTRRLLYEVITLLRARNVDNRVSTTFTRPFPLVNISWRNLMAKKNGPIIYNHETT